MTAEPSPYGRNGELGRIGKTLVAQLFILLKTSQNYAEGHAALDTPVANVLRVVREIVLRNEEAVLRVKTGNFYLGELRLKTDSTGFEAGRFVMEELKRHQVGGISFHPAVTASDLSKLVYIFREVDALGSPDAYGTVLELMQQRMVVNIEVETIPEEVETVQVDKDKRGAKRNSGKLNSRLLYKKALNTMDEVMAVAGAGQTLRLKGSKRVVQHMIDLLPGNEFSLLGLTTTPCRENLTSNHAVNVCILSLVMGRRLGMSKFHLCELGMAALFHDIGTADVPREILDRAGELSAQEQLTLEAHPLYGVKKMMLLKGLDSMSSRIITGVFEHHLLADFSGYPRFPYRRLSLFGRIISIADCYEALTSVQPRRRTTYPPDKALRFMLTRAGKAFDLALLKLFINCVGIYGIGSLLLLDSKELAVIVENNPAQPDNPRIRVIADSRGREVESEIRELAQPGSPRSIVSVLDPHPCGLDVSWYFT